jgi:hypothetical protein
VLAWRAAYSAGVISPGEFIAKVIAEAHVANASALHQDPPAPCPPCGELFTTLEKLLDAAPQLVESISVVLDGNLLRYYQSIADCEHVVLNWCHCRRSLSFTIHAYLPCCQQAGIAFKPWWDWPGHPVDRMFFPEDCVNPDGSLRVEKLRARGWVIHESGANAPPGYEPAPWPESKVGSSHWSGELTLSVELDEDGNPTRSEGGDEG